jgi:hypothetical protein
MAKFNHKLELQFKLNSTDYSYKGPGSSSKEEQSQATTNQSTRENLVSEAERECLKLGRKPESESISK